jgi:hypothetical protein
MAAIDRLSAGLYRHPLHGLALLISRTVRRGVIIGFTLLTSAGERWIAGGSLEEKEWRPLPPTIETVGSRG